MGVTLLRQCFLATIVSTITREQSRHIEDIVIFHPIPSSAHRHQFIQSSLPWGTHRIACDRGFEILSILHHFKNDAHRACALAVSTFFRVRGREVGHVDLSAPLVLVRAQLRFVAAPCEPCSSAVDGESEPFVVDCFAGPAAEQAELWRVLLLPELNLSGALFRRDLTAEAGRGPGAE